MYANELLLSAPMLPSCHAPLLAPHIHSQQRVSPAAPVARTCVWLSMVEPVLQADKLRGRAVYFVRITTKAVTDKTVEQDIAAGQIGGTALDSFRALMTDMFVPVLKEQNNWGKTSEEYVAEFMQARARPAAGGQLALAGSPSTRLRQSLAHLGDRCWFLFLRSDASNHFTCVGERQQVAAIRFLGVIGAAPRSGTRAALRRTQTNSAARSSRPPTA